MTLGLVAILGPIGGAAVGRWLIGRRGMIDGGNVSTKRISKLESARSKQATVVEIEGSSETYT